MLSVSQSAAFCRWLSEVLFTTNWKYEMKNIQLKNIKYCARWKMLYIHFTMNQLTTWITLVPLALYASSLILVINPFTSSLTSDRFCNQQIILYNGWNRDVHCTVYSVQCTVYKSEGNFSTNVKMFKDEKQYGKTNFPRTDLKSRNYQF